MKRIIWSLAVLFVFLLSFNACKTTQKQNESQDIVFRGKNVEELLKSGDRKLTNKNYKGALEDFDKAVELDPYGPDIYNYRGIAKLHLEDFAGALMDFNKTIELQPDYAEAYNLRGIVKGELNDDKGACEDWERAFELGFTHAFILLKNLCNE